MAGSSQKSTLTDWLLLLKEALEHETELADLVALREELQLFHTRTLATRGMRDTLQKSARDASQRLRGLFVDGQKAADKLRRVVKSVRRAG